MTPKGESIRPILRLASRGGKELYSVKPKATCHVTRQSKYQCTRLCSVPNL